MAYTPEQYKAAGEFILANINNPQLIADTAQSFGLSTDDLLRAAQMVNPNLTSSDATRYFSGVGVDYQPQGALSQVAASNVFEDNTNAFKTENNVMDKQIADALGISQDLVTFYLTPPVDDVTEVTSPIVETITGAGGNDTVKGALSNVDTTAGAAGEDTVKGALAITNADDKQQASSIGSSLTNNVAQNTGKGALSEEDFLAGETELKTGVKPRDQSDFRASRTFAEDYLMNVDPNIQSAFFKPGSSDRYTGTFVKTYTLVDGKPVPINATAEDIAQGNVIFMVGGAPSGEYAGQERVSQAYVMKDGVLTPVGTPKSYKAPEDTPFFQDFLVNEALPFAASVLAGTPGPLQFASQAYLAAKGLQQGDVSSLIKMIAPPGVSAAVDVYKAVESGNYIGALTSVIGQTGIGKELSNIDLGGGLKVSDAMTAASVVDRINAGDYAGALKGVGSLTGSAEASTAGNALQLVKALESGNLQAIATAGQQLINNVNNLTAKSDVANLLINSKGIGAIDADLGSGDQLSTTGTTSGALSLAGDPQLDLANQQRIADANQAIADYIRSDAPDAVGLANQLKALGFDDPQTLIDRANTQIATNATNLAEQRAVNSAASEILNRYSKIDPQSGYMGLDRETAREQLIAAGLLGDQAEAQLQFIDDQVAEKIENAGVVRDAYSAFLKSAPAQREAAETALRESMSKAGYTPAEINNQVLLGRGVIEGQKTQTTGEQAQERAASLPDIRAEIAGKSTFGEAYATAREKLGPGATFTWQGKDYVASSAEERPDLVSATKASSTNVKDEPFVASNGMHNRSSFIQQGGGTSDADYAKYVNAVNAVISQGLNGNLIKPSSVNSTGKDLPSTTGLVTMETPKVDSLTGSILAMSASSLGANTLAGPLSALGFTELGAQVLAKANAIASVATAAQGPEITADKKAIDNAIAQVGKSENLRDAAVNVGNLVSTLFQHPKGFGVSVAEELLEEVLQINLFKGLKAGLSVKELITSAQENGGAAYNETFANEKKAGASDSEAHKNAQIAAGSAASATVLFLGGGMAASNIAGRVIGSKADDVATGVLGRTQDLGKTTIKESIQEFGEEGAVAGAVDLMLNGAINPERFLTNATGGLVFGGPTSGVMQATGTDAVDTQSTSIGAGTTLDSTKGDIVTGGPTISLDPTTVGSNVGTQIQDLATGGGDLTVGTNDIITSTLTPALDLGQSITTLGPAVVTAAVGSGANVPTVVGATITVGLDTGADAAITTGTVVPTAVKTGLDQGADSTVVIGGTVTSAIDAASKTASDVNATTTSSVAASVATAAQNGVDVNTATKAATDAATKAGVDVTVDTTTEGSVTTTTAVSGNTTTSVAVDTANSTTTTTTQNNNGTTQIVANPNGTTTTKTDGNVTVVTETNNTTKVTTTTQTDATTGNQIVTTVDPTTGTKTTTATDGNTGQTTSTTTNLNTNVTSNVNTNVNTNVNPNQNVTTNVNIDKPIVPGDGDTVPGGGGIVPGGVVPDVTFTPTAVTPGPVTTTIDTTTPTTTDQTKTTTPKTTTPPKVPSATAPAFLGAAAIGLDNDWLKGKMLKSGELETYRDPLAGFQALQQELQRKEMFEQLEPALAEVLMQRETPYYSYGEEAPIDDILGLNQEEPEPVMRRGGAVSPLQMTYARGGREDFRHGKHVAGEGDGQSDDIPAWLADGEFVFPADVVSALGNGSTKAGTNMLYEMMHEIRKRARSKGPKDLPPPAHKSPLDYLKSRK